MVKKKNKNKITFMTYLGILLLIVSVILCGLIYFIDLLPLEYFIVMLILFVFTDAITIKLLISKKIALKIIGGLISLVLIIAVIMGINYELSTIDFLKQFGFNSYKTENYNVIVLENSKYEFLTDLDNMLIGYLDPIDHKGYKEVITKVKKEIDFKGKVWEDSGKLINALLNNEADAIILEDAQLSIIEEEDSELYNKFKIIKTYEINVKIEDFGDSVDITKESFNVLISGIDTYGSITSVARSDVNILVTVNPKSHKILLTNIPRDYYVLLHSFQEYDKLTHAGIYGINESVNTIEDLLDTNINYYIKVNFTSLIDLVDALGGITINSNYDFISQDGYHYKAGMNTLNGKEALSFARERKAFAGGDRVRGENQEIVLTALINKAFSAKVITNYSSLLNALKDKFVTNLKDDEIVSFVKMQLEKMPSWQVDAISLDGTDTYQYTYSYKNSKLYVMQPDRESIDNAIEKINLVLKD